MFRLVKLEVEKLLPLEILVLSLPAVVLVVFASILPVPYYNCRVLIFPMKKKKEIKKT